MENAGRSAGRRIVSLWMPRMAAERMLRRIGPTDGPFAMVAPEKGALKLVSLCPQAEAAGLRRGMGLPDARAVAPGLITRLAEPEREAAFLAALARWAQRYSPWTATDGADGLILNAAGCAHLFGGEAAMLADMLEALAAQGLTARAAIADTRGAAWALARFAAGQGRGPHDREAVGDEARAPAVRAPARPAWRRADAAPEAGAVIAPPGGARAALALLPPTALRLPPETAAELARLGLRTVGDLAALPRAGLARRFGLDVVRRLDQALGAEPEPVAVGRNAPVFAARLSAPEPLSRVEDVQAGLRRLLERICAKLEAAGAGARALRLTLRRVDGADAHLDVGLAQASRDAEAIARLFARPIEQVDAGYGIDALRLIATAVEPLSGRTPAGHLDAAAEAEALRRGGDAFAALLSRLGNRLGFDALIRFLPADSHIPARSFILAAAAWSEAHGAPWPAPPGARPVEIFPPEPAPAERAPSGPFRPPARFRWRGREHRVARAFGPERIAPEWWLDDPDWREGPRDYWRAETEAGLRVWLFHLPAGGRTDRWFVEGLFA
jgi:protein ImuB